MIWTWVWCIVMILALLVEVATAGTLVSIWFTIGGLFALILSVLNAAVAVQVIVFGVVSGTCILLLRPIASKILRGDVQATNYDRIINQHAKLTKAIEEDACGELHHNGTTWNAVSYDGRPIAEGTYVTVLAIDGNKVVVKSID